MNRKVVKNPPKVGYKKKKKVRLLSKWGEKDF